MHRISNASKDKYTDSKNPNTPPRSRSPSPFGEILEDIMSPNRPRSRDASPYAEILEGLTKRPTKVTVGKHPKQPTNPRLEKLVSYFEVPVLSCTPPTPSILHPEPVLASGFMFDTIMESYESISAPPRPCTSGLMPSRLQTPLPRSQSAEPSYSSGSLSSTSPPSSPTSKAQLPRTRSSSAPPSTTVKVKCSGTTVAGKPCKLNVKVVDFTPEQPGMKIESFCHHHHHQKKIDKVTSGSDHGGSKASAEVQKCREAAKAFAALADLLSADSRSFPEALQGLISQLQGWSPESESGDSKPTNGSYGTADPKPVSSPKFEALVTDDRPSLVNSRSEPLPETGGSLSPHPHVNLYESISAPQARRVPSMLRAPWPQSPPPRPGSIAHSYSSSISSNAGRTYLSPAENDIISRPRAISAPTSRTVQCSGLTHKGKRCKRPVRVSTVTWADTHPDEEVTEFCRDHRNQTLDLKGTFSHKVGGGWIEFQDWIPGYLQTATKRDLRRMMAEPRSADDKPGYIYTFQILDPATPQEIHLKVGRTVNLVERIHQWSKQCGSKAQALRGCWPETVGGRLMKGTVEAGNKGPFCYRLEQLVHLELKDLEINRPYLERNFQIFTAWKDDSVKVEDKDAGDILDDNWTPSRIRQRKINSCQDCGTAHKEIFSFVSGQGGPYEGREWESVVKPVIEKWGAFVSKYV